MSHKLQQTVIYIVLALLSVMLTACGEQYASGNGTAEWADASASSAVSSDAISDNTVSEDEARMEEAEKILTDLKEDIPESVSDAQAVSGDTVEKKRFIPQPTHFITDAGYSAALSYTKDADLHRLASVMKKAERGEDLTIGLIGGSITQGVASEGRLDKKVEDPRYYANIFFDWWKSYYPDISIKNINAGIAGTDSYLGLHRAYEDLLHEKPDLVVVEYSVNDKNDLVHEKSYEHLVRNILSMENSPAVILLFMAETDGTSAMITHIKTGEYYRLPMLSYADAMKRMMEDGRYSAGDLSGDRLHPSVMGHAMIGELLWRYLNEVYENADHITDTEDTWELPEAFTPGNYDRARFLHGDELYAEQKGSFTYGTDNWAFKEGYTSLAGNGGISFKAEFANLGISYIQRGRADMAFFDVYVDGVYKATLNGRTRVELVAADVEIYTSDKRAEHTVTIYRNPASYGGRIEITGLLTS